MKPIFVINDIKADDKLYDLLLSNHQNYYKNNPKRVPNYVALIACIIFFLSCICLTYKNINWITYWIFSILIRISSMYCIISLLPRVWFIRKKITELAKRRFSANLNKAFKKYQTIKNEVYSTHIKRAKKKFFFAKADVAFETILDLECLLNIFCKPKRLYFLVPKTRILFFNRKAFTAGEYEEFKTFLKEKLGNRYKE